MIGLSPDIYLATLYLLEELEKASTKPLISTLGLAKLASELLPTTSFITKQLDPWRSAISKEPNTQQDIFRYEINQAHTTSRSDLQTVRSVLRPQNVPDLIAMTPPSPKTARGAHYCISQMLANIDQVSSLLTDSSKYSGAGQQPEVYSNIRICVQLLKDLRNLYYNCAINLTPYVDQTTSYVLEELDSATSDRTKLIEDLTRVAADAVPVMTTLTGLLKSAQSSMQAGIQQPNNK